jgi:CO/xanthine dehydrogenase Mo-binding subunit
VVAADTDLTPVDLGAYSSRVTFMVGLAAREACQKLAEKLRAAGGDTFAEACQRAEAAEGAPLAATGGYRTQKLGGGYRGGTIGASPAYSFTAHVAEVSVDEETGIWKVERIWAAHDCGKALNPTLVEGQIEGSVYMGAAEAQMEEMVYDDKGLLFGPSLLDYRIPTSLDTPDLESYIVESNDPAGPYGAKEAGEGPLHPAIPAIANALHDACGIRIRELPFYPQRVLKLLRGRAGRREERAAS